MANSKKTKGKSKALVEKNPEQQSIPDSETAADNQNKALKSDFMDDFLFHAANYIYVRRKLFIALSIVVVVLICSGWGTFKYIEYRNTMRNEALFNIENIIFDTTLSDSQKDEQAFPLLESFLKDYPDSAQSKLALFYRAGLNFSQKKYKESETDLRTLLSSLETGSDLFFLASLNLSNVLRDQNRIDEAVEILKAAKTDAMSDIILMEQAELFMSVDQQDKAKEVLQILLKDYPESYYANKAKQLLEIM